MAEANGRKPNYVVRTKQSPDSDFWVTIGAAWKFREGKDGLSLRLHTVPVMWTGECILVPPLEDEDTPPPPPEKGRRK